MLLGFNGSPKQNGNLRRILEMLLESSGKAYRIYDLATMNIRPCVGCVKCAAKNRCVLKDDMHTLYDEIVQADAVAVGAVVYFGKANAFCHTFLERLYPLRHLNPQTLGKPGIAVAVGGHEAEQVAKDINYQLASYYNFEMLETLFYNSSTPPCFTCGFGTTCKYGGPARWMSPEEFENFNEITPEMFQQFESDKVLVKKIQDAGKRLGAL